MEGVVHRNAHALLALTHAEGAAELNLITEIVLRNQILQLLNYLTRTLNVAGATDTNRNFKHNMLPLLSLYGLGSTPIYGADPCVFLVCLF